MNIATLNKVNFYTKLSNICVFLLLLASSLYFTQQRSFPYVYHDEYGVLGAAAIFSGLAWETSPGMAFYGFLLSLLTFPLYWLDLGPTMLYRLVLAVNSLLVASSALLALRTIRLLMPEGQPELWKAGAVFAGFSYPAVMHYSALAVGETTLLFCFFLIAYYLVVLLKTNHIQICSAIILGVGIGMAQYTHPRGVVYVFTGIGIIYYAYKTGMVLRANFIITVTSAFIAILLLAYVKAYLLTNFYSHKHENASLISFISARMVCPSIDTVNIFLLKSIGQLIYLVTSTFGLIILGFSILVFTLYKNFKVNKALLKPSLIKSDANIFNIISGFILSSFILMFVASVLQMVIVTRADSYFYGRYNEILVPALIIVAIIYLSKQSRKCAMWCFIPCIVISMLSVLMMDVFFSDVFQMATTWSSVTSWIVYINGPWIINPKVIFIGFSAISTVLVISLFLSRIVFVIVLVLYFSQVALLNFEVQHKGADRKWKVLDALSMNVRHQLSGKEFSVNGSNSTAIIMKEAIQFAFPRVDVNINNGDLSKADGVLDYTKDYCTDKNTLAQISNRRFCILNNDLYNQIGTLPLMASSVNGNPIRKPLFLQRWMSFLY